MLLILALLISSVTAQTDLSTSINVLLYTRQNRYEPITITDENMVLIDTNLPAKFFIHGWNQNYTYQSTQDMKEAYLNYDNLNFFTVDWDYYANQRYTFAFLALPQVGEMVAEIITKLVKVHGYPLESFHLVGHSLGAHISGHVGQEVQRKNDGRKLPRITGLDAAGPFFQMQPLNNRLSGDDAQFVDGIHTNGAIVYGLSEEYGSIDVYPNGGEIQPGCGDADNLNVFFDFNQLRKIYGCSHERVRDYWMEGISSDKFVAKKCTNYEEFKADLCGNGTIVMGERTSIAARGRYYLDTNGQSPYARG